MFIFANVMGARLSKIKIILKVTIIFALMVTLGNISYAKNRKNKSNQQKEYIATVVTNYGSVSFVMLNETPAHRDNFIKLAKEGYYNGMDFHRVVKDFVIQAGDPNARGKYDHDDIGEGDIGYTIGAEIVPGMCHYVGAVGMAREDDSVNPQRLSSGSHFYFVQGKKVITDEYLDETEEKTGISIPAKVRNKYKRTGGSPHLDGKYTVFGYVIEGMAVLDSIAGCRVNEYDVPDKPVTIEQVFMMKRDSKGKGKMVSFETEY